jgi:hypothetical protein
MTEGVAPECVDLLREYLDGGIGTMEFALKMEPLRLNLVAQTSSVQPQGLLWFEGSPYETYYRPAQ